MNMGIHVSAPDVAPHFFGCTLRSGVTGSDDNSMLNFLNHVTMSPSGCGISRSHKQLKGSILPMSSPTCVSWFGVVAILTGGR